MAVVYAARYAQALLEVLQASHADGEQANRELGDFDDLLKESPALRSVYVDPSIKAAKKLEILDRLNERLRMSKSIRNFLAVVIRHERMEGFGDILGEFRRMLRGELAIDKVEWTSARALDGEERRAVEARIHELTGRRIEASFLEDPTLLGGARLRIGSTIYDGSVRGRLESLKESLAER